MRSSEPANLRYVQWDVHYTEDGGCSLSGADMRGSDRQDLVSLQGQYAHRHLRVAV